MEAAGEKEEKLAGTAAVGEEAEEVAAGLRNLTTRKLGWGRGRGWHPR